MMKNTNIDAAFNARLQQVINEFENWSEISVACGFSQPIPETAQGNERTIALMKI